MKQTDMGQDTKKILAYIAGVALGDGNLSNPNGRATRLRITCDKKYKNIIKRICAAIQKLLPNNKVSLIKCKSNCINISCYSNQWEDLLGWKALGGSKYKQKVSIPDWIIKNRNFSIACLRGLLETDGSIYKDRGYQMVNFVTIIPKLATNVMEIIADLGFKPRMYKILTINKTRYNIRISQNTTEFIKLINFIKD
ncbi:LAGLIDADG family homing endonuclease [Candidatus Uhrbacteria bacterium]|nr:LAGLIDADG family homing endonuclease [Candidatus Uhrbacteria bacterium]